MGALADRGSHLRRDAAAFLATTATRLAITVMQSARARRESQADSLFTPNRSHERRSCAGSRTRQGPGGGTSASNGTVAFRAGVAQPHTQFVSVDPSGRDIRRVGNPDSGSSPSASPDLDQAAVLRRDAAGNADVWLMEARRGLLHRFTLWYRRKCPSGDESDANAGSCPTRSSNSSRPPVAGFR